MINKTIPEEPTINPGRDHQTVIDLSMGKIIRMRAYLEQNNFDAMIISNTSG